MNENLAHLDPVTHADYFTSHYGHRLETETDPLVREYWQRGYIRLSGLFTREETAAFQQEAERLLSLDLVTPDNLRTPYRANHPGCPERIDPVVDISPIFARVAADPRITDVVAAIFRDKPLLFKDKLIFKAPGATGYSTHQDQAWWQLCAADDILSVSLQIDGADAANGCIELFPEAHGNLLTPIGERTNFRDRERALIDMGSGKKIETIPGDLLIFHSLAPHQSDTNRANVFRRSFYLTYSAARQGDQYKEQLKNYLTYLRRNDQQSFR